MTGVWRWDGTTWSTVGPAATGGTGVPVAVERMIGTASGLYVGSFIDAWNPINTVSRWDGCSWETNIGGLAQGATSFCLFDDGQGHGEELYIGINGEASGGGSLLRWDGNEWSTVAEAPGGPIHALLPRVRAGGGRSLVLGGAFVGGPHGEAVLAEWDACVEGCEGDVDGDGAVGAADLGTLLGSWGEPGSAGDVDGDGVVTSLDLAILLGAWGPCG